MFFVVVVLRGGGVCFCLFVCCFVVAFNPVKPAHQVRRSERGTDLGHKKLKGESAPPFISLYVVLLC